VVGASGAWDGHIVWRRHSQSFGQSFIAVKDRGQFYAV
jgi:hypothetical protein